MGTDLAVECFNIGTIDRIASDAHTSRSGALRRSSATPGVGAQYSPTRAWGPIIESGMSTNPHADDRSHMTCTEVLQRIYEYLDGELTTEVELQIRDHLAFCRKCFPHFRHEQVFLRFMERRATIAKAPPALRRRIMQMLIDEEASRPLE